MEPEIQPTPSSWSGMDVEVFCMIIPQYIQEHSGKSDSTLDTRSCVAHSSPLAQQASQQAGVLTMDYT
jgi:hypothetical protein